MGFLNADTDRVSVGFGFTALGICAIDIARTVAILANPVPESLAVFLLTAAKGGFYVAVAMLAYAVVRTFLRPAGRALGWFRVALGVAGLAAFQWIAVPDLSGALYGYKSLGYFLGFLGVFVGPITYQIIAGESPAETVRRW